MALHLPKEMELRSKLSTVFYEAPLRIALKARSLKEPMRICSRSGT